VRLRRDLRLPPLPALASTQDELERLAGLVAQRTAVRDQATAALVAAQSADAAERRFASNRRRVCRLSWALRSGMARLAGARPGPTLGKRRRGRTGLGQGAGT
jgi:hypothetical protein